MNRETFISEIRKLGIVVTDVQMDMLDRYYELLIEWNEKINLTAITVKEDVYLKHFYDSLTVVRDVSLDTVDNLCDIGTGAGFPGIVLKIFYPKLKITLVDALSKRINFLNTVIQDLGLVDIVCVHARAEEFALKNREKYDIAIARAVASLNVLLEYSLPMVKVHGYFIAMKGSKDDDATRALSILGGNVILTDRFVLPCEESQRMIIKVEKIKITDDKYPRKFAEIKKKPL